MAIAEYSAVQPKRRDVAIASLGARSADRPRRSDGVIARDTVRASEQVADINEVSEGGFGAVDIGRKYCDVIGCADEGGVLVDIGKVS